MKNLNPYPEEFFTAKFKQTDIYKRLSEDFNKVSFDKFYWASNHVTPRQMIGGQHLRFSATPFYYIDYLLEKNPKEIYDLGCGWNIFKKYIDNLIGIGAESPNSDSFFADIHDFVDDDFIKGHHEYFESVFSICALHFNPLTDFSKIVNDFYTMLKPGGRGFLSINLQRMIDQSPKFMTESTPAQYDTYCRSQLDLLTHIKFLVVDIDLTILDEALDGNIRLVMEKS